MPDRSDTQEEETSSEDDRYHQYGSDDNQEIEDKAPMAKKNVIKLAVRESSDEDKEDEGSTSRGTKRPLKDSDRPMLKKAKVPKQDEKEESRGSKSKQREGKSLALEQKSSTLESSDDEEDDSDVDDDSDSSEEESTATISHHHR